MASDPRLLKLLRVLLSAKKALHWKHLHKETGYSRSSIFDLLGNLRQGGFLEEIKKGRETHVRLSASVSLKFLSQDQVAALLFANQLVASLQGSKLARELGVLVASLTSEKDAQSLVRLAPPSPLLDGAIFDEVQKANEQKRRLRFMYQSNKDDAPRLRTADPLLFYIDGEDPYLEGFDIDIRQQRTFKLARMSTAQMLDEPADPHPEFDARKAKLHSRKVWDGPQVKVVVRLAPHKARFAREWPLKRQEQHEHPQPDGSVLVSAWLAGTEEALKWVLSWGAGAWVIAPTSLREDHLRELRGSLEGYEDEKNDPSRIPGRREP